MKRRIVCIAVIVTSIVMTLFVEVPTSRAITAAVATYAQHGPLAVGTREIRIDDGTRPLDATIWYPALNPDHVPEQTTYHYGTMLLPGHAITNAALDMSRGPYPLVIFSHGAGGLRYQSRFFTEHLASYGFVVIASEHPGSDFGKGLNVSGLIQDHALRPYDVLHEIAYADKLTAKGGDLEGLIDTQRIGLSGHSFGGYTVLAAGGARLDFDSLQAWCRANRDTKLLPLQICPFQLAQTQIAHDRGLSQVPTGLWPPTTDPRIKSIVAMAPWDAQIYGKDGLASVTVPTMILVGTADRVAISERDAYVVYDDISSVSKSLVTFDNANHFIFVDKCATFSDASLTAASCSDAVWDMDNVHDLINHFATAQFLVTLKGDVQAAAALKASAVDFAGVGYKTTGQ